MSKNGFGKLLAGAAIGGFLGVLFAPKKGETTRKELMAKVNETLDSLKETDPEEVKESFTEQVNKIKEEVEAIDFDALKDKFENLDEDKVKEYVNEKIADLKADAEKLVDYAKEKGTPVLEKAAEELKDEAIKVTKETLNKLEESKKADTKKTNKKTDK
jgi:gas vesicle protein